MKCVLIFNVHRKDPHNVALSSERVEPQVYINKQNQRKLSLSIGFGTQKNRLIETVLLSTHNICFG